MHVQVHAGTNDWVKRVLERNELISTRGILYDIVKKTYNLIINTDQPLLEAIFQAKKTELESLAEMHKKIDVYLDQVSILKSCFITCLIKMYNQCSTVF